MNNKLLVTGGTGTVGSNIPYGQKLSSKDCDLRNILEVKKLFKENEFNKVLHLGARVGGLKFHIEHKYELFYDNLTINTNVINSAREVGIKRVLSYLSSCIFSDDATPPYREQDIHFGPPAKVHEPYGYAKRMLDIQSKICFDEGFLYNCIVPVNIYGIDDNFNYDSGHVVACLIRRAFEAHKSGNDFVVWGDGKQQRDFIFTEDIAKLTRWALENYFDREPLIFSSNQPVEIGYLAYLIAKKFNIENKLVFDITKPSGQKIRKLNGDKLASLTNFKFTNIEDGISKSVDWFVENYTLDPALVRL